MLVHNTECLVIDRRIKEKDLDAEVGSTFSWTGSGNPPKWHNHKSKAYGHTLGDRDYKNKAQNMQNRAEAKGKNGQWDNDKDIIIAEREAPNHPGKYLIDF